MEPGRKWEKGPSLPRPNYMKRICISFQSPWAHVNVKVNYNARSVVISLVCYEQSEVNVLIVPGAGVGLVPQKPQGHFSVASIGRVVDWLVVEVFGIYLRIVLGGQNDNQGRRAGWPGHPGHLSHGLQISAMKGNASRGLLRHEP
jgi:hypothetical protein